MSLEQVASTHETTKIDSVLECRKNQKTKLELCHGQVGQMGRGGKLQYHQLRFYNQRKHHESLKRTLLHTATYYGESFN